MQLAVLATAASVIAVAAMPGGGGKSDVAKQLVSKQRMEKIEKAAQGFAALNGRRPCPADATAAIGSSSFGRELPDPGTCTGANFAGAGAATNIVGGGVPTVALGLPDEYAFDGFGRRITYVVDKRVTNDETCSGITSGAVDIRNTTAGSSIADSMWALVSYGKNAHGAYTMAGSASRIDTGSTDTDTQTNAFVDGSFSAAVSRVLVQKAPTSTFDDLVWYNHATRNTCCYGDSCATPGADCNLPWGGTTADNTSVTAYEDATVPFGDSCVDELRDCDDGTLSGTYTNQNCTVDPAADCNLSQTLGGGTLAHGNSMDAYPDGTVAPPASCPAANTLSCNDGTLSCDTGDTNDCAYAACSVSNDCALPWGGSISNGQAVTAYSAASVPFGGSCNDVDETRTCTNGVLSGSFTNQNCSVTPGASCNLPWGGTIAHAGDVTAYQVDSGAACPSETRTCNNGTLSGTYTYQSCTVDSGCVVSFSDDFNAGVLGANWTTYGGTWSKSGGILSQTATAAGDPRKAMITNQNYGANLIISAKVRVNSWVDGDGARAGVGLYTTVANGRGYNLVFHNNKNTVQFLRDGVDWGTSYNFEWSTGTWYYFKLAMIDGVLYGKVWDASTTEPVSWPYQQSGWTTYASTGAPALNGGSSVSGAYATVSFDDVTVTPATSDCGAPYIPTCTHIIDNADAGFAATSGTWTLSSSNAVYYNNNLRYLGNAAGTATFTKTGLAAGTYNVGVTYNNTVGTSLSTAVPFSVYDGTTAGTLRGTVTVNQQVNPSDFTASNWTWLDLGNHTVNSGTLTVQVANGPSGTYRAFADAICIQPPTCTLPWGGTIGPGESVTAYQTLIVSNVGSCVSETRTCTNGTLSGSYTAKACNLYNIIDNDDTRYAETSGTWNTNNSASHYNNYTRYLPSSSTTGTATYTFTGLAAGTYNVAAGYNLAGIGGQNTSSSVPFSVYDGTTSGTLRGTVNVNQTTSSGNWSNWFNANSYDWTNLGNYTVNSGTLTVKVANAASGTYRAIADAVRIEAARCSLPWGGSIVTGSSVTAYQTAIVANPATCASESRTCTNGTLSGSYTAKACGTSNIIDNNDTGFVLTSGIWSADSNAAHYNGSTRYISSTGGSTGAATYTFTGLAAGTYNVAAGYNLAGIGGQNTSSSVPFSVYDGTTSGTLRGTVNVNQQLSSGDWSNWFNANSYDWTSLGNYTVNSGTLTVKVANAASGTYRAIADAVRIEAGRCSLPWGNTIASGASTTAYQNAIVSNVGTCASETRSCTNGTLSGSYTAKACNTYNIVDDGDTTGFQVVSGSGWSLDSSASHYNGSMRYLSGTSTVIYTFTGLTAGDYNVSTSYYCSPKNCANFKSNVPFSIYDGTTSGTLRGTVNVNQQADTGLWSTWFTANSKNWTSLGNYTVNSGTLTVQMVQGTTGGSYGALADAVRIEAARCTLPWGETIASGASTTAYQSAIVANPATCTSETRTCSGGTLSGSYTAKACNTYNIIDDADTSFQIVSGSGWTLHSSASYYNGSMRYLSGTSTVIYTFTGLAAGDYKVAANYTCSPKNCANFRTSVPFSVYDGTTSGTLRGTVNVNQQVNSADFAANGYNWKTIGTYTVNSGTLTVQIVQGTGGGSYGILADAVRIEAGP